MVNIKINSKKYIISNLSLLLLLAFAFFVDKEMQSFYRRFVRDYMRYKDYIQCAGKAVLEEVRKDALIMSHGNNSDFYALHIRRGDFQFKVSLIIYLLFIFIINQFIFYY